MKGTNSILLIISVLLLCIGCNMSNTNRYLGSDLPPSEPGKCYAKCLLPAISGMDTIAYLPIYTGDHPETVEMAEYVVREAGKTSKWEKVKRDGCHSAKKDDCLVWCLKEVNISKIAVNYVLDTLATKEYELQAVVQPILNEEGKTAWKTVLCEKDIKPDTYLRIAKELNNRGYISNTQYLKYNGDLSKELKAALINFQKDNYLPIGQLDIETLRALGYMD